MTVPSAYKDADKMKIELMLLIYETLIGGKDVARGEFCRAQQISERTFYRYMRELSAFLRKHKPGCRIEIVGPDGRYFLEKSQKNRQLTALVSGFCCAYIFISAIIVS